MGCGGWAGLGWGACCLIRDWALREPRELTPVTPGARGGTRPDSGVLDGIDRPGRDGTQETKLIIAFICIY